MTVLIKHNTRRWPRHHLDVPIRVIVHSDSKTSVIQGRGNELSEGGMALTAGVELRPGDQTEIEFTPPYSGLPIRIRAQPDGLSLRDGVCGGKRTGSGTGKSPANGAVRDELGLRVTTKPRGTNVRKRTLARARTQI